ncbi:MAG: non-ribosomal peptide synthetase, partial [Armatimonadetes bacterium]|nr:non-ribosomal peptide synthetase [Armatimonadota bacterium]
ACPGVEVRAVGAVAPAGAPDACLPRVEALVGPAYVFFTSGSTGTPKAVLGTHEGLAHFIRWQGDAFAVQPGDRCALLTGLSFDVVLRDLFLPLTHGATLCLPQPEDVADGVALFAWLDRSRVSLLHAVPSLLRHWLAEYSVVTVERVALGGLRCLFLAGEPLTGELVTTWRSAFPQSGDVMNLYGPTETTLAKFCYRVPDDVEPGLQPVGQPLPDTEALVLAPSGRRCGLYEPGEVAIRTAFRTRGYLNAETENALRFIENPFHQIDPDDRIYLTGDRGYFRADGDLVVVGRLDQQVKLRGVRIELGEVEAALRQHPAVREAAVDVRSSPHGEAVLAAYVVTTDRAALGELRRFLADRLPAALVPATYTVIDRLPLSPSGKLVRRSLPNPAPETATAPTPTGPRDDVERRLCAIWSEVLRAAPTSIHDDFFQAGGHSLLAVQLLIRVERAFGRALPLAAVMHAPTIAEMARLLETGDPPVGSPVLVPIQPSGHRVPIFAVHGIGGGVMCYLKLSALLGDEQPFYGLQAPALGGAAPRHLSVEEMAAEYVQAVREVQPAGPYHLLGLSFGGNIALEMAQQLRRSGAEVAFLGLLDSKGPGYPRFPGRLARAAAHVAYFLKQPAAGRSRYLRVRLVSLRDLIRRRMLGSWYRRVHRAGETLPRLLEDIGLGHLQAAREYRRDEYPGRIILFRAEQQPVGCIPEWDNGWSRVAQEGVEVHAVPGEHAEIVEEPYVQHLAQALRTVLSGIERTPER